jgi:hypothetical protein
METTVRNQKRIKDTLISETLSFSKFQLSRDLTQQRAIILLSSQETANIYNNLPLISKHGYWLQYYIAKRIGLNSQITV